MADRVALVREFYGALPTDRVKVETHAYGFGYLDSLRAKGASLDYGELTGHGLLHKYKLSGVTEALALELLQQHVASALNVCLYFRPEANGLFCVNLDNNHRENNTEVIPEMAIAVEALRRVLTELRLPPLVIASGRGYHLWVRLAERIDNTELYTVMVRACAVMMAQVQRSGGETRRIKANFYPDIRSHHIVSLRLFGSLHAKNRVFSQLLAPEGLLGEEASWDSFATHLHKNTVNKASFEEAHRAIVTAF